MSFSACSLSSSLESLKNLNKFTTKNFINKILTVPLKFPWIFERKQMSSRRSVIAHFAKPGRPTLSRSK
jgi:hypothetical protein